MLRDWAFDESNLSSATASGLLVGLRENTPTTHITFWSPDIFIKLLPPRTEEQSADSDNKTQVSSQRLPGG